MPTFLEKHKLPKLKKKIGKSQKYFFSVQNIKSIILKTLEKSPDLDDFTSKVFQIFKYKIFYLIMIK